MFSYLFFPSNFLKNDDKISIALAEFFTKNGYFFRSISRYSNVTFTNVILPRYFLKTQKNIQHIVQTTNKTPLKLLMISSWKSLKHSICGKGENYGYQYFSPNYVF